MTETKKEVSEVESEKPAIFVGKDNRIEAVADKTCCGILVSHGFHAREAWFESEKPLTPVEMQGMKNVARPYYSPGITPDSNPNPKRNLVLHAFLGSREERENDFELSPLSYAWCPEIIMYASMVGYWQINGVSPRHLTYYWPCHDTLDSWSAHSGKEAQKRMDWSIMATDEWVKLLKGFGGNAMKLGRSRMGNFSLWYGFLPPESLLGSRGKGEELPDVLLRKAEERLRKIKELKNVSLKVLPDIRKNQYYLETR